MNRPEYKYGRKPWTQEEDEIVKDLYPKSGYIEIANRLPWRSSGAISRRAFDLGLHASRHGGRRTEYVIHLCEYCFKPIPIREGVAPHVYNRTKTCSNEHAILLALRTKASRTYSPRGKFDESPEVVAASEARDRGDHSLIENLIAREQ
jgi:hypothetical protein